MFVFWYNKLVFVGGIVVMEMDEQETHLYQSHFFQSEALIAELVQEGVYDERVLAALRRVSRHEFVRPDDIDLAYENIPLNIGDRQTISQPSIVGLMSQFLELKGNERVLEVGTGSGYQAAVLSCLAGEVMSIEIVSKLARSARDRLFRLGYHNVTVFEGDGTLKYMSKSPYDAILVAAAARHIPQPLIDQLAEGGRLVMPVGSKTAQELIVGSKIEGKFLPNKAEKVAGKVKFVPLTGKYGVTAEF